MRIWGSVPSERCPPARSDSSSIGGSRILRKHLHLPDHKNVKVDSAYLLSNMIFVFADQELRINRNTFIKGPSHRSVPVPLSFQNEEECIVLTFALAISIRHPMMK